MRELFSVSIAVILLLIYVGLIGTGVAAIIGNSEKINFTPQMGSALSVVAGLVSALVIAELSATKPGEVPAARLVSESIVANNEQMMKMLTSLYLFAWLLCGLAAFAVHLWETPKDALTSITDYGQTWLGIAVGAGYAYFGIKAE